MILCDEVFEILTRGPFPTGAPSDGIVESHLKQCAGCRELAEALRPAVELFQEAVTPEESRTLPSYWGEPSSNLAPWLMIEKGAGSRVAQRTRRAASPRGRSRLSLPSIPAFSLRPAARLAAALLLGLALAGLLRQLGPAEGLLGLRTPGDAADQGEVHWLLAERGAFWFDRNGLSQHCIADASAPIVVASRGGDRSAGGAIELACCSSCHVVDRSVRQLSQRAMSTVANACGACHPPID
ncbi:MAG TPA: hypothetical protein VMV10_23050 [Pirellulales bacterium]|nr:hypothetical protein [Pirellulales bacterium]